MTKRSSSKLRNRILKDPKARRKLARAASGQKRVSIELDDRTYSARRIRVFDQPAEKDEG